MGSKMPRRGSAALEIVVIVAVVAIVIAVGVPAYMRNRAIDHARICQENLAVLDAAKDRYILEHSTTAGPLNIDDLLTTDRKFGNLKELPACPDGGTYSVSDTAGAPECSVGKNKYAAYAPHVFSTELPFVD